MPVRLDLIGGAGYLVTEDMGVAPDQLGDDPFDNVIDPPGVLRVFLRYPSVEDDLEQQIAKLFAQAGSITGLDRLDRFIGLLDEVLDEALMGLPCIPRSPARRPQAIHHLDEGKECGPRLDRHVDHS